MKIAKVHGSKNMAKKIRPGISPINVKDNEVVFGSIWYIKLVHVKRLELVFEMKP